MISAIICVKDREKSRVENCIKSLKKNELIDEIIVVDYGSEKPINTKLAKVIRFKNKVFNKSHALNLGIKASKNDYIMTLDCDMIIPENVLNRLKGFLGEDNFIISTNVRRINMKDLPDYSKSWDWYESGSIQNRLNSKANGGMQVFSRKWIYKVRGYDENLILFGAIDNDLVYRAQIDGINLIDVNLPIYHQEHSKRKEQNLDESDRKKAEYIRKEKARYMWKKIEQGQIINPNPWGTKKPNQNKFMHLWDNFEKHSEYFRKKEVAFDYLKKLIESRQFPIKDLNITWMEEEKWQK